MFFGATLKNLHQDAAGDIDSRSSIHADACHFPFGFMSQTCVSASGHTAQGIPQPAEKTYQLLKMNHFDITHTKKF